MSKCRIHFPWNWKYTSQLTRICKKCGQAQYCILDWHNCSFERFMSQYKIDTEIEEENSKDRKKGLNWLY